MFDYQKLGSENQDNNQNWTQNNLVVLKIDIFVKKTYCYLNIVLEIYLMQFQKNVILNQKLSQRICRYCE